MVITQEVIVSAIGEEIKKRKLKTEIIIGLLFNDPAKKGVCGIIDCDFLKPSSVTLKVIRGDGEEKEESFSYEDLCGISILSQSELLAIISRKDDRIAELQDRINRAKNTLC